MFEDENLNIPNTDKSAWLNSWHSEIEWLRATHKTLYSNGIIGLNEQMDEHPLTGFEISEGLSEDEKLIRRFRQFQRHSTAADLLFLSNNSVRIKRFMDCAKPFKLRMPTIKPAEFIGIWDV